MEEISERFMLKFLTAILVITIISVLISSSAKQSYRSIIFALYLVIFIPPYLSNGIYDQVTTGGNTIQFAFIPLLVQFFVKNSNNRPDTINSRRKGINNVLMIFLIAFAILLTVFNRPISDLLSFLNTFFLGILFFYLVTNNQSKKILIEELKTKHLPLIIVFQSGVAISQYYANFDFIYENPSLYLGGRSSGTFGYPLILAFFVILALIIIKKGTRPRLFYALNLCATACIFTTESRAAFLALVFLNVSYVARSSSSAAKSIVGFIIFTIFSISLIDKLGAGLIQRFEEDFNSIGYRRSMLTNFLDNIYEIVVFGGGMGSDFASKASGLTRTSYENGWLSLALNFGLLWVLFFFMWILKTFPSAIRHQKIEVMIIILLVASNSGLSFSTTYNVMFFLSLLVLNDENSSRDKRPHSMSGTLT